MTLTKDAPIIPPVFENIPEELKHLPNWVCWKPVERKRKDGTIKITKPPFQPNGKKAESNNAFTWSTYDAAFQAYNDPFSNFEGVGFMLDHGYTGIDLDNCIDDEGNISPVAKDILSIVDSYYETSVSGTGIHIILKGSIPDGYKKKNTKLDIEIYNTGRFFTMTGKTDNPKPLKEQQEALNIVLERYFKRDDLEHQKQNNIPQERGSVSSWSNSELWEKMFRSKNGSSIRSLYEGQLINDDHSSTDQALCNHLAFWTNKDAAKMDSMFRESGLYRPKWDELRGKATYGELTISRAIQDTKTTLSDFKRPSASEDFEKIPAEKGTKPNEFKIIPKPFIVGKNRTLFEEKEEKNGDITTIFVSRKTPYVTKEFHNVERPQVLYEIEWNERNRTVKEIVPASTLATKKELMGLSDKGFSVNDNNAKKLIKFFDQYLLTNEIEQHYAVERLGNIKVAFIHPLLSTDVEIMAMDYGEQQTKEAFQESGTVTGWKTEVWERIKDQPKAAFIVLSSFASVLLNDLQVDPFIVDLSGSTSQGKTTTLKLAASVWGTNRLINEWNSTKVSIERKAAYLNSFPLLMDDTRKAEEKLLQQIIYQFSGGRSKGRGSVTGSQKEYTWNNILISTGEVSLTEYAKNAGGAAARVIPIIDEPLKKDLDMVLKLHEAVEKHFGVAGIEFIKYWIANKENLKSDYLVYRNLYSQKAGNNEVLSRLSAYYAAVHFAGTILQRLGFNVHLDSLERLFEELAEENKATDKPKQMMEEILIDLDSSRRCIMYDYMNYTPEVMKAIYKGDRLYITPKYIKTMLDKESNQIRREWLKKGLIIPGDDKGKIVDYHKLKHKGQQFRVIALNMDYVKDLGFDFNENRT